MSLHDKIHALGEDLKEILHALAEIAGAAAPVAEAIETVADPAALAPTEEAAKIAETVATVTAEPPAAS